MITNSTKRNVEGFWNANPCGTTNSWVKAQSLRFQYTDPYLMPILEGPLLDGRRVLEIGCGQGLDAERIVQKCREYTGIDLSETSVAVAQEAVGKRAPINTPVAFQVADAERLPFEDCSFDTIYSIGVLHHTPDFDAAISEVHRVLEPGGQAILMLYRSFTPLWIVLRTVRGFLRVPLVGPRIRTQVVESERLRLRNSDNIGGTAMLELFGCPVIKTYTLSGLRRRFRGRFAIKEHELHRVGVEQVIRILPKSIRKHWPQDGTGYIERTLRNPFGFYLVLIAERI
jgi:SAM-dependent methyltransferase